MVLRLFENAEFNGTFHVFCFTFRPETPFSGKFVPKKPDCQFKLKCVT